MLVTHLKTIAYWWWTSASANSPYAFHTSLSFSSSSKNLMWTLSVKKNVQYGWQVVMLVDEEGSNNCWVCCNLSIIKYNEDNWCKVLRKRKYKLYRSLKINISLTSSHFLNQEPDLCPTSAGGRTGRHPYYFQLSSCGILCKHQYILPITLACNVYQHSTQKSVLSKEWMSMWIIQNMHSNEYSHALMKSTSQ